MKAVSKKFVALLLVLVLCAGTLPLTAAAADYSRYVGLWTYNETRKADGFPDYNWYSKLTIKSVSGGRVNFNLTGGREFKLYGPSRVCVMSNITTDPISNNQANFRYSDDGWGNSGHGTITFREDGVMVSVTQEQAGKNANYSMEMTPLNVLLKMDGFVPGPITPTEPDTPKVMLSPQKLTVNGADVDCEKYNIDGSNYFKLRDLAYLLSGTGSQFGVGYDNTTNTVTVTTGAAYAPIGTELAAGVDNSATAQGSAQTIMIDGKKCDDLTVYNIGGSNFFKLRDLGTALDFEVGYDEATNTATVRSK